MSVPPRRKSPALLAIVLLALLGFAIFFVGFLLAPLLILLVFTLAFMGRNRSGGRKGKRRGEAESASRARLAAEATLRDRALGREKPEPVAVAIPPRKARHTPSDGA